MAAGTAGEDFSTNFELPDSDSEQARSLLEKSFPTQAGDSVQVVLHSTDGRLTDPSRQAEVSSVLETIGGLDGVVAVDSPLAPTGVLSPDGTIGLATAQLDARSFDVSDETVDGLLDAAAAGTTDDLEVELGGDAIRDRQQGDPSAAELVGLGAAIIILLITFGSVVAMSLPILTAVIALGVALSLVTLGTHLIDTADFSPQLAAMIGLGVGIDYALFVVTRFRSGLRAGLDPAAAVEVAMDTAGRAVLFAGATVCVALLGLFAIGVDFLYGPALAASLTVLVTMTASLTLLPALLSKVGTRIDRLRLPGMKGTSREEEGRLWSRWSVAIQRRPWTAAIASALILIVMAIPVFSIELGNADAGTDAADTTTRKAYDLLAEGFGPGFNGPLLAVSDLAGSSVTGGDGGEPLARRLAAIGGVAAVSRPVSNDSGDTELLTVFPTTGPQEVETRELVDRIRSEALVPYDEASGAESHLGGETAVTNDFSTYIAGKLPLFMGVVILLSALLIMIAFRSVLVPVKAVLMNVLSIAASFGVIVAVFQFGWGDELIGISEHRPDRRLPAGLRLRDRLRPLDGLRGLPDVAGPRGVGAAWGRLRRCRARSRQHRSRDHGGGDDHDLRLRQLRARWRSDHQAVRRRAGLGDRDRRLPDPQHPRAGGHGAARRARLVAAGLARSPPASSADRQRGRRRGGRACGCRRNAPRSRFRRG